MGHRWLFCLLAALAVTAHAAEDSSYRRNRDGTINYAPRPGTFTVIDVDTYHRVVRLRTRDGTTTDVRVPDGTFDLHELQPGATVQVDFLVPDRREEAQPTAATIWPLR